MGITDTINSKKLISLLKKRIIDKLKGCTICYCDWSPKNVEYTVASTRRPDAPEITVTVTPKTMQLSPKLCSDIADKVLTSEHKWSLDPDNLQITHTFNDDNSLKVTVK